MRIQAKIIIGLGIFTLFSYLLDAATTSYGLAHGAVEQNASSAYLFVTIGQIPAFLIGSIPMLISFTLITVAYIFTNRSAFLHTKYPEKIKSTFLWLTVTIAFSATIYPVGHLIAGIMNFQHILGAV